MSSLLKSQGGFRVRIIPPGSLSNVALAAVPLANGHYLGYALSAFPTTLSFCSKLCIYEFDSSGTVYNSKFYGDTNTFYSKNVLIRKQIFSIDSSVFFIGYLNRGSLIRDAVVVKFNGVGDTLWQTRVSILNQPVNLYSICKDNAQNLYAVGQLESSMTQNGYPTVLVKLDAGGKILWIKQFYTNPPYNSAGRLIAFDSINNRLFVHGYEGIVTPNLPRTANYEMLLDTAGTLLLKTKLGQSDSTFFGNDIFNLGSNKFCMSGSIGPKSGQEFNRTSLQFFHLTPSLTFDSTFNFAKGRVNGEFNSSILHNGNVLFTGFFMDTTSTYTAGRSKIIALEKTKVGVTNNYYEYLYAPRLDSANYYWFSQCSWPDFDGGWTSALFYAEGTPYPYGVRPLMYVKYGSLGCDTTAKFCSERTDLLELGQSGYCIEVFPNPAHDDMSIVVNSGFFQADDDARLIISNSAGEVLINIMLQQNTSSISLADLTPGIYVLEICLNGQKVVKKLIKT